MGRVRLIFIVFLFASQAQGQLSLTLTECEEAFQKNNLHLLAEQYNISVAEAGVVQAKLWQNPYVFVEVNAYNPDADKFFDVGRNGQKIAAVEQLIHLGGKKKNEIALAKTNVEVARMEFSDLLRQLKYQLRVSYFNIYHDYITLAKIDEQLNNLDSLVAAYTVQAAKNNVPYKDLVRLQSLYLSLKNSKTELLQEVFEHEMRLAILLSEDRRVELHPTPDELEKYHTLLAQDMGELLKLAEENRPEYQLSDLQLQSAALNRKWQKSLAVPDITLGAAYDQRGGAFNNQLGLTLGLPLPIINRNQGNIKIADSEFQRATFAKELVLLQVRQEVEQAFKKYKDAFENYGLIAKNNIPIVETVFQNIIINFQKRNISILEFTDFVESYYAGIIQFNKIKKELVGSCEEINYYTNATLF